MDHRVVAKEPERLGNVHVEVVNDDGRDASCPVMTAYLPGLTVVFTHVVAVTRARGARFTDECLPMYKRSLSSEMKMM